MKPVIALVIGFALLEPAIALAQPTAGATTVDPTRDAIVNEMVDLVTQAIQHNVSGGHLFQIPFGPGGENLTAAYLAAPRPTFKVFQALLDARSDKQVGSTPTAQGSTSLAMKGLAPEILGIAVENGALQKDVSGTTVSFRAKPMGIIKALQGNGLLDTYIDYSRNAYVAAAARFSGAVSFDTSRGSTPGTLSADLSQLSSWSVRAEILNQRNPAASANAHLWKNLAGDLVSYQAAAEAVGRALNDWPAFKTWQTSLLSRIENEVDAPFNTSRDTGGSVTTFKKVLNEELPKLDTLTDQPPTVAAALDAYVKQLAVVQKQIDDITAVANKGALLTVDWSTARDPALPDLYTVTGIFETALGKARKTDFTLNVASSFYRSRPDMASSPFKSFDMTAQLEHPLGASFVLPSATAAISVRYAYLPNDTVASTTSTATASQAATTSAAVAPKGNIGVFQAKLTVPVKGTGVKVPLSITASNRTELIKEKDVRASFGITFDFDTFLTALTAKAK